MKYIRRDRFGALDLTEYEDYIEREFAQLDRLLRGGDILAIDRFVPSGPRCFHDSRFETLSASTGSADVAVELSLKGPYFDRYFWLRYRQVHRLVFQLPSPDDDLSMHELRCEDDFLVHELQFSSGALVEVVCKLLVFEESLV